MTSTRTPKPELVLATWPDRARPWEKLGDVNDFGNLDEIDSFWLELRSVYPTDPDRYRSTAMNAWRDVGLWVWMSAHSGRPPAHSIEPRLHAVHSATLDEATLLTKMLRGAVRKMPAPVESFEAHLLDVCHALGIRNAIEYRGGRPDTIVPVWHVTPAVTAEFNRRIARCTASQQRKAQQSA